jgi:lipid A 4'-phosphatase
LSERDHHIADRLWPFGRSPALFADPIVQVVLAIVLVSLVFIALPGIDVWFSRLFFDPDVGFPMSRLDAFIALRPLTRLLLAATVVAIVVAIAFKLVRPLRPTPIRPCDMVFLLSSLVIGPGIVVNAVFKEFWGRPRPDTVELFGGETPFVGIWQLSDHCLSNCSFVSGEAAVAIWLVAVAMVLPGRWRRPAVVVALALAVLLSFNRIAFGRHFLSDVLLAWGLTLLVIVIVHRIVVERPPAWLANDRLERGLTVLGMRLRGRAGSR